jgi:hypothetical protein
MQHENNAVCRWEDVRWLCGRKGRRDLAVIVVCSERSVVRCRTFDEARVPRARSLCERGVYVELISEAGMEANVDGL